MKYRFIKSHDKRTNLKYQWMFYCDSFNKLVEHTDKYVHKQIEDGVKDMFYNKDNHPRTHWRASVETLMNIRSDSFLNASLDLENKINTSKKLALFKKGHLLLRENGSYMFLSDSMEITEEVYKKTLVWPEYSEEDIKINKWRGGQHFYAKLGEMDVVGLDGSVKWDTYKEAFLNAKHLLTN